MMGYCPCHSCATTVTKGREPGAIHLTPLPTWYRWQQGGFRWPPDSSRRPLHYLETTATLHRLAEGFNLSRREVLLEVGDTYLGDGLEGIEPQLGHHGLAVNHLDAV